MATKYTRDPTFDDFLEWIDKDTQSAKDFYYEEILPAILELEADDYFGTEGFDKRYG